MAPTKEDLLKPLFDFQARHGFKLSELTGHRVHKWAVHLDGQIYYEGVVKIQEELGPTCFSSNPNIKAVVSLVVEGEGSNYFNSEQMLDVPNRVAVSGLWEKNVSDPDERNKYYYFEPISIELSTISSAE